MLDAFGREINYLRVSVTDRCNLRCCYCMPRGHSSWLPASTLLTDEQILRICRLATGLGISRFKITGGEPLLRPGLPALIRRLKQLPGVEQVTLTTNGLLLKPQLEPLMAAGLDAVNLSLDTLQPARFSRITGADGGLLPALLGLLQELTQHAPLKVKVNTVILGENQTELPQLADLARQLPTDVRFIERMPLGCQRIGDPGQTLPPTPRQLLAQLQQKWPDLHAVAEVRGNGPASYYASKSLKGRIGVIAAVSNNFCAACNRLRLTCTGQLKSCLCYDYGADLRPLLQPGVTDLQLEAALRAAIWYKPAAHCFADPTGLVRQKFQTEIRCMNEIGG
ncbi:GTP 3',8-cyclase MoaA [Oscillospiraceae bacterium HV4-5-C5C]|nr:GTP 3',8-cyclase MoaA [Oscillospiraceae bacterium HV4-5-C5C]